MKTDTTSETSTTSTTSRARPVTATATRRARVSRIVGSAGNLIEWYDFAVFGASIVLLAAVLTPGGGAALTGVYAVFAISFLARPLGAVLVARVADRRGRRRVLTSMLGLMTAATAGIGLLPSWAAIGVAATVALLVLRLVQGFSSGGEMPVSVAYLVEHAPPRARGLWGGTHLATTALGFAAGTGAVAAVRAALDDDALLAWGWRVPFLVALPLGLLAVGLLRRAAESPDFESPDLETPDDAAAGGPGPRPAIGPYLPHIVRGFALSAAFSSSYNIWFVYLPARLVTDGEYALDVALTASVVGTLALAASAVLSGRLSDRIGRRPVLLGGAITMTVAWLACDWLMGRGAAGLFAADTLAGVALGAFVIQSALGDVLPARVRASGIAYSLTAASAVVGGSAPLVASLVEGAGVQLVGLYAVTWLLAALVAAATWSRTGHAA
ncbi:MFS transporter [Cellulomonas composti]|uniref:MFS transporter n=1 Tax=Cellulomonas composti TaxID=266130 RepID=A0A511J604_9CELL|nr:MFS transporter [Cellulomonas composti]GEL93414.1 MFS transporter [Cellulomonas composti]